MGVGRFVGRVGALAVALGVGVAVSSGCAVAWAADTSGGGSPNSAGTASGSGASADGTSDSNSGSGTASDSDADGATPSVSESAEQDPDETAADPDAPTDSPAEVRDDSIEQEDTGPAPAVGRAEESSTSRDRTKRSSDSQDAADPTAVEVDRSSARSSTVSENDSDSSSADSETEATATTETAAAIEPQAVMLDTVAWTPVGDTADAVAAEADSAIEPTTATAELAGAVAASLLDTGAPGDVPVDTPAEWVVLAAARRELADPDEEQPVRNAEITFVTAAVATVGDVLSTAVRVLDDTITGALGLLGGTVNLASSVTGAVLTSAVNVVSWGIATTTSLITGALNTAAEALADAFDSEPTPLGDAIAGTLTFLNQVVTTTVDVLSQAATSALTFTTAGLTTAITLLGDLVTGTLDVASATIDIVLNTVNAFLNPNTNTAPIAGDDVLSTVGGAALVITAAALLANDTDPDNDELTLIAVSQGAHGTTTLATDGTITYTPAADYTGTDTFTYTITDGTLTDTASVTVTEMPTTVSTIGTAAIDDAQATSVVPSPHGTWAIVVTSAATTTGFTVVDTVTGAKVGDTVTLDGDYVGSVSTLDGGTVSSPLFNSAGTRAVVDTITYDYATSKTVTRVAVIDTTVGAQLGSTLSVAGTTAATVALNADGSRAVIVTAPDSYDYATATSQVLLLDTVTGDQVGSPRTLTGTSIPRLSSDGTRLVVTTTSYASGFPTDYSEYTAKITVIDTGTGAQVGNTITKTGIVIATPNTDGSRLIVSDLTGSPTSSNTTKVTEVNASTGAQIGSGVTFTGGAIGTPALFSADGSCAVVSAIYYGSSPYQTKAAVIDMATGGQVGVTVAATGLITTSAPQLNPKGTRVVLRTQDGTIFATTAYVSIVNTATGGQVGSTQSFGLLSAYDGTGLQFSADGTRALVTSDADSTFSYSTRITVLNTTTGAVVSNVVIENWYGWTRLTADGGRVVATAGDSDVGTVAVLAAATGAQVDIPLALPGAAVGSAQLSSDGTRGAVTTTSDGATEVMVFSTATGAQIGTTFSITGSTSTAAQFSSDGTAVVLVTTTGDDGTGYTTTVSTLAIS